jgi:hypothetical protein
LSEDRHLSREAERRVPQIVTLRQIDDEKNALFDHRHPAVHELDYFVWVRGSRKTQQPEYRMADRSIDPHNFTDPNPF